MGWQDAPPVTPAAQGTGTTPAWQNAPAVDPTLNAVAQGVKNQGRVTEDMLLTKLGGHNPPVQKLGRLPFTHQAVLASMDNPSERRAFLEQEYGKGSVSQDSKGLIVKGKDGKPMRASSSFSASLVAEAPETTLGIAGAASGALAGGPIGAIAGAAAGAGAGKTIKEGVKAATGTYRKTPGEYTKGVERAMEGGAEGEIGARGAGKVLSRLTRGPLPGLVTGSTPETKAMTERVLAKGARPPAVSTMPDARKLQRIALLADKLSGPSHAINRANTGYLQDRAMSILDKAGLAKSAQGAVIKSLDGVDTAISTQQTGQMIQSSVKSTLAAFKASSLKPTGQTAKAIEYLKRMNVQGQTPEDTFNHLVRGGQGDLLEKFIGVSGKNSPVVQAVQMQALKHLFAGAMESAGENQGAKGITKELAQFTTKQQRLLFPNGLDKDLKMFDNEIRFLYPAAKDPSMAGFTSGSVMQKKFYERWYHQAVGALYRGVLQQPAIIRRLAVGFRGDSPQRKAARLGLRELFYFGAVEASEPSQPEQPQK
jgi:hypothetical protein